MELVKRSKKIRVCDLQSGDLFTLDNLKTIAVKSEYRTREGVCECYIIGSGEMFWGGTSTADDLNNLLVYRVDIK